MQSRFQRCLADPAVGGQETVIRLLVRRFFCDETNCAKRTFCRAGRGRHRRTRP
ncbi:hypothetical protein [Amycolatopsis sp. NPDC004378]